MRSFIVFLQKEFTEQIRTNRLLILVCIFAIFGIGSPFMARYMQEFIDMAAGSEIPLILPDPVWIDGWQQFYGNLTQIGALTIMLLFMGCISGEKQSGSAALTLTKNLSHSKFVMAKFASMLLILVIVFLIAVAINFGYTYWLFDYAGEVSDVLFGAMLYCLGLIALVAIIVLASALTKSVIITAMISFAGYILMTSILPMIPVLQDITPGVLMTHALEVSAGESFTELPAVLGTLVLVAICLIGAIQVLKRQEI
jgi:ABC-2 type transport system permease protein